MNKFLSYRRVLHKLSFLASVRLSVVCLYSLSVCCKEVVLFSVVCNVRAPYTQAIKIFGNVSTPFGTLAICDLSIKLLRRPPASAGGLNRRGVAKYSDFGSF